MVTEKKNTQRYALWCSGEAFDSVFIQAKDSNSWVQVKRRRYGTSHDVTFADMPLVDTFQFKFRGKKNSWKPFALQRLRYAAKDWHEEKFGSEDPLFQDPDATEH